MAYHPTLETIKSYFPGNFRQHLLRHRYGNIVDIALHGFRTRDIAVCVNIPAMLSPSEREFLFRLGKENNPANGVIVEIGVYAGGSAYFLGKGAQISGSNVYGIDPFDTSLDIQEKTCDGSDYLQKKPSKSDVENMMEVIKKKRAERAEQDSSHSSYVSSSSNSNSDESATSETEEKPKKKTRKTKTKSKAKGGFSEFSESSLSAMSSVKLGGRYLLASSDF